MDSGCSCSLLKRISKCRLKDGRTVSCKAGTQRISSRNEFPEISTSRLPSLVLAAQVRSAQWEFWHRVDDLWLATGSLVATYMEGLVSITDSSAP